ncbi:MAG: DNA gyrase modulator [Chitinophagaceae bacterium]
MVNRKGFIQLTSMSVGALAIPGLLSAAILSPSFLKPPGTGAQKELADSAFKAIRQKGASYADVRMAHKQQFQMGIRVLVGGAWGFAVTSDITNDGVAQCVENAMNNARQNTPSRFSQRHQYDLRTPHELWMSGSFSK